jgi:DNA-binding IclR family transcriptional regulator
VQILEVGAAIPWHACALGHAIVANLPPPEAARAMAADLTPLTGRTKTTKAALGQALAQVRRRGYALEDQEATVGDAGIAAPIVNRAGTTVGSIGLVGPAERLLASAAVAELARAVAESARSVSRDLGVGTLSVPAARVQRVRTWLAGLDTSACATLAAAALRASTVDQVRELVPPL